MPAVAAPPSITAGCHQPKTPEAFEAAFTEATVQRHSLPQLTCAAALSYAVASRKPADVDMQMLALDAHINLLEQIQMQLDTQTYQGGDAFVDLKARWALGIQQGKVLSGRLAKSAQAVPSIAGLRIAFDLVSVSSSLVQPDVAYRQAAGAFKPLAALLEKNPKLLDGVGEMMLGRLYYQLPETAGGDMDQAAVHLGRALAVNRKSIVFQRWYAESLVALGRKAEALEVLAKMLPLQPEAIERQSFADELRAGTGLAQRAGDDAMSERLAEKRAVLLKEFPELKTRQPPAISGHGGVDPLTGKSND
ncbi:tetratricopeptide repeat protein [Roseateles sp.]|uniref:tetratricopeptide repeat protein n=1 Tax=Roseateles sp. TaxID=1971397 RepID=UPI0039ED45A8